MIHIKYLFSKNVHDDGYYAIDPSGSEWWFQHMPSIYFRDGNKFWDSSSGFINTLPKGTISKMYGALSSDEVLCVRKTNFDFRNPEYIGYLVKSNSNYHSIQDSIFKQIVDKFGDSYLVFEDDKLFLYTSCPIFKDGVFHLSAGVKHYIDISQFHFIENLNKRFFNKMKNKNMVLHVLKEDRFIFANLI